MLDSVLSKDVLIVPCKGILRACAMSLPVRQNYQQLPLYLLLWYFVLIAWGHQLINQDFWRSRRCLQEIEGFDHSVANSTLGACGDLPADEEGPCLPFPIWQCGESKVLYMVLRKSKYYVREKFSWFEVHLLLLKYFLTRFRDSVIRSLSWNLIS